MGLGGFGGPGLRKGRVSVGPGCSSDPVQRIQSRKGERPEQAEEAAEEQRPKFKS